MGRFASGAADKKQSRVEKEYHDFFSSSLGPVTSIVGLFLGYALLRNMEQGAQLAFTPEEVDALAGPLSRIMAKQNISTRVRKAITSSGDYTAIAGVMLMYGARIFEVVGSSRNVNSRNIEEPTRATRPTRPDTQQPTNGYRDEGNLILSGAYNTESIII